MDAKTLIGQSIARDEITHADYSADLAAELHAASQHGGVRNGDVTEYWGWADDGNDWRVHLDHDA